MIEHFMGERQLEKNSFLIDSLGSLAPEEINSTMRSSLEKLRMEPIEGEINKSPELISNIDWLANNVREFVQNKFEIDPIKITSDMIHLVAEDVFMERFGYDYKANPAFINRRGIIMCEEFVKERGLLDVVGVLIHELFHICSVSEMYATVESEEIMVHHDVRLGMNVKHGKLENEDNFHFSGLDEVITDRLTRNFFQDYICDDPKFHDLVIERDKKYLSPEQIERGLHVTSERNAYQNLWRLFRDMINKIYEMNSGQFKNVGEVEKELLKPYFMRGLKSTAKLINGLGKGCFKDLAEFTAKEDLSQALEIIGFRKKYNLPEDSDLQSFVERNGNKK